MVTIRSSLAGVLLWLSLGVHVHPVAAQPCHLKVALSYVGVREATGRNDGPEVKLFLASVGLKEGPPWCAAFPHQCYRECGWVLEPARRFAMAAAWHPKECRIWEKAKHRTDQARVRPGDHGALFYDHLNRIGHEFMVKEDAGDYVITVEGNTNGGGSREGDGVYIRKRLKRTVHCFSRW